MRGLCVMRIMLMVLAVRSLYKKDSRRKSSAAVLAIAKQKWGASQGIRAKFNLCLWVIGNSLLRFKGVARVHTS